MPLIAPRPNRVPKKSAASGVSRMVSSPAPIGGLNFRDSVTQMPVEDATLLRNFLPRRTGVSLRPGWKYHTTALPDDIGSLFAYNAGGGQDGRLFAASGGDLWNVTETQPEISASGTGSLLDDWDTVQFANPAGNFLLAVSPGAGYWTYDGSTWTHQAVVGLPANPTRVWVWKRRVWFAVEDSSQVFYLDTVDSITGTAVAFEMGSMLNHGGNICAGMNWTMDAGVGIDDFMVVIGTEGDVSVWQGTDPTSAATFGLKGFWYVGPVPRKGRFFTSYGGDVMILSELGLVPLSKLVNGQFSVDLSQGPSAKVQPVLSPLISELKDLPSFDLQTIPSQEILLIRLPPQGALYQQYAMNVTTGAWSTLHDMSMTASSLFGGDFYFATDSRRVALGFYGDLDAVETDGTLGEAVTGELQPAFNAYETPGILKQFVMARPIFVCEQPPSIKVRLNTQYSMRGVAGSPSFTPDPQSEWDQSKWDIGRWASSSNVAEIWVGVRGLGYYGALRMRVRGAGGSTSFSSYHVMAQLGGAM